MSQGLLPFKYEIEKREGGLTALGGVGLYLARIFHKDKSASVAEP
jgi:hypothetical protein